MKMKKEDLRPRAAAALLGALFEGQETTLDELVKILHSDLVKPYLSKLKTSFGHFNLNGGEKQRRPKPIQRVKPAPVRRKKAKKVRRAARRKTTVTKFQNRVTNVLQLIKSKDKVTAETLSKELGLPKHQRTHVIERLRNDGLIESTGKARGTMYQLTEKGRAAA